MVSTTALVSPLGLPGLWVDLGHYQVSTGRWLRQPRAVWACAGCPFTAAAVGPDQVRPFITAVAAAHQPLCPAAPTPLTAPSR